MIGLHIPNELQLECTYVRDDSILWAQSIISLKTDLCQDIKEDSINFAFIKRILLKEMDFGAYLPFTFEILGSM